MCIHSTIQNKTDIVGSFLRPDRLKKAREQFAKKGRRRRNYQPSRKSKKSRTYSFI